MNTLPEPFTAPDCDLRGYHFMPLLTQRLLDSDLFAMSTGDEFKAAIALWCKAWQQLPAGSLPDNDRVLAHLSGVGLAGWEAVREMALHGWVKCVDGRLYHPVIAEEAAKAWKERQRAKEKQKAYRDRQKKKQEPEERDQCVTVTQPERDGSRDRNVTPDRDSDRDSNNTLLRKDALSASSTTEAEGFEKSAEVIPLHADARSELRSEGLKTLCQLTGLPERRARGFLGKLLKRAKDDAALVQKALDDATELRPVDPQAWLMKAVQSAGQISQLTAKGWDEATDYDLEAGLAALKAKGLA